MTEYKIQGLKGKNGSARFRTIPLKALCLFKYKLDINVYNFEKHFYYNDTLS